MTTDLANRLGNTFIGAVAPPAGAGRLGAVVQQPSRWHRLARAVFAAPGRLLARIARRQAARDALIRYAMCEGRELGLGRIEIERAVLLSGRADTMLPSYFINAHRR